MTFFTNHYEHALDKCDLKNKPFSKKKPLQIFSQVDDDTDKITHIKL